MYNPAKLVVHVCVCTNYVCNVITELPDCYLILFDS